MLSQGCVEMFSVLPHHSGVLSLYHIQLLEKFPNLLILRGEMSLRGEGRDGDRSRATASVTWRPNNMMSFWMCC